MKLKEFKKLWNFIKEEKNKIIIASILIFIVGLTSMLTGYLNGAAIESITNLALKEALIYLGLYLLFNIVVNDSFSIIASSLLRKVENVLSRKLEYFTYQKSLNLPSVAFETTSSGEIINRITNDTESLSFSFGRLLELFSSGIGMLIISVYVFMNSWIVGVEIIFFLILLFLVIKHYNPKLKKIHKERKFEHDEFTSLTNESIRGIREIKTLGIKNNLLLNTKDILTRLFNKNKNEIDTDKRFSLITKILKSFLEVGTFITCVILLYYGKITLTFFIAMTYYVYKYMWLIENINSLMQVYQKVSVSIGRINEILQNKMYDDEKFGTKNLKQIQGKIEFKNVNFSYANDEQILDNFNITFMPNKKQALVGKSGQGKTTIFNLITRIFDTTNGEIFIDDTNIKDLTEESLRNNISVIRQEPFIFNRTILENFKLVNNNISLEEVRKYTKMAYLDDYIMSLPNKYDTILGEGGINLSGGQKQRLAIARTLAKNSKIILFDEATSALDNKSQMFIKQAIDSLVKDHTIIIVAHRLSTIIDADIIYVVDKGKIVASGTHQELLKTSKIYKELYESEEKEA